MLCFNSDKTGKLSIDNLVRACEDANVKLTKKEIDEMLLEADTNGDGFVDTDEFIRVMLQTNLF